MWTHYEFFALFFLASMFRKSLSMFKGQLLSLSYKTKGKL